MTTTVTMRCTCGAQHEIERELYGTHKDYMCVPCLDRESREFDAWFAGMQAKARASRGRVCGVCGSTEFYGRHPEVVNCRRCDAMHRRDGRPIVDIAKALDAVIASAGEA